LAEADNPLRQLPQVARLLDLPEMLALCERHGRAAVKAVLNEVLDDARRSLTGPHAPSAPDAAAIHAQAAGRLAARSRPGLRQVINATGIVLHTNLGRAPLASEALDAVRAAASGYANLEFDLAGGARGSRTASIEPLLREVTGAQAALAVNNGAAAILLALSALAAGGEVIVSRGELVEIGGGFRVPDVIRQGGARLVEVGSTNKTRVEDYAGAITEDTRILLKVHQSNFRTIGFTAEAGIGELSELASAHGLTVVADLGSGLVAPSPGTAEPTIGEALAAGADVVTCSGDKLLGGPQAGLVLGKAETIAPLRRHPLLRALRLDKMTLAALEATLRLHRDRPEAIPVLRMLGESARDVRARAEALQTLVGAGEIVPSDAFAGGGSLPEQRLDSFALAFDPPLGVDAAAQTLRAGDPAVVGRIHKRRLLIDLRTVAEDELPGLAEALRTVTA
jgi:L-seryl-tRNA(Ser) seleniumtransferase